MGADSRLQSLDSGFQFRLLLPKLVLEEKVAKGDACHHRSNNEVSGNIATLADAPRLLQQQPLRQDTKYQRQQKNDPVADESCEAGDQTRQIGSQVAKHYRRQQNNPLYK